MRDAGGKGSSGGRLAGRTVLVTGATSGTGLACAVECHRLGAHVWLGSRSRERYEEVARHLGPRRVHPFIADLAEPASITRALATLLAEGPRPTDLVHSAAGGLEPILRPLLRTVAAVRRMTPGPERDAALAQHREELARLVEATSEVATRVNTEGPRVLVEGLAPALPRGARIVAFASIWSEAAERGGCPAFYGAVARSKLEFERWLAGAARGWVGRGIVATVLVGHIISDTSTGKLIDRNIAPLLSDEDQDRFRAGYVTTGETATAVADILTDRTRRPGILHRLYLAGAGGLALSVPPEVWAVAARVPL
jgi:NAD(P)-dependent dehydrogenase (short-subunit alcohol dehydrogenase family)